MANHEVETPDRMDYTFLPVTAGSILFKVQAANDAHIALTTTPDDGEPLYEIFIGGWQNAKSAIRKNKQKPDVAVVDTPAVLSASEPRGFWMRWTHGDLAVGTEGSAVPFLTWKDPEPFGIGYYGIRTGWGATGTWYLEDGDRSRRVDTEDKLEYSWHHVQQGCLNLEVCCPHNAHIALTCGACESDPMYEVLLGGWENMASVIRYKREKPDKVRVNTPALLTQSEFRRFCVAWKNGQIRVVDQDGNAILEWTDPSPIGISHFGVRTAWGACGKWKIGVVERPDTFLIKPSAPPANSTALPGWAVEGGGARGCATWVDCNGGVVPPNAVTAGIDSDGQQLFVGRARHEADIIPGKVAPAHRACFVPWGGEEHAKSEYQVLCNCEPVWLPAVGGRVPPGALPGGVTGDGETLFIGRATHQGVMVVGKIQESHNVCYIPYGGAETACSEYEVLCAD
ncbi:hypothetical protein ONE63_001928 [Megalurothrips usitatus]|uniref:Farnesoic acid O-methyl transferase domain-containing protein n=1 Tax=Megalurothrips usitatus TaxID=439358 RepID=A0AAV7XG77_9NEOP|nr:hypothetical protein ONE63_001928 [Megalurothrips usitatus]